GLTRIDADTVASPGSWEAALRGLGAALGGALSGWRRPRGWADPPVEAIRQGEQAERGGALGGGSASGPSSTASEAVAVCIVTHHDAADVPACFAAIAALEHRPLEVVVVDCASGDGTPAVVEREAAALRRAGVPVALLALADNRGFAGGMNAAFAACGAPWLLTLNADARPAPGYLGRLLARAAAHPELAVGAVTGRLVRPAEPGQARRLDACGMRLTRTWRHLDRGSSEPDRGQYARPERVFGGTGAATLFRRAALDDAALAGEVFDPRFHSFREDAELAFRLRERGWEVLYEPAAVAEHRRRVLPERRAALPAAANLHSLKNRYLLRVYHQTGRNLLRTLLPAAARDLAALAYVLAAERSSLPAYAWLWRHRRELLARRRAIQARRRVPPAEIDRWFGIEGLPL
ncbi:MAG TPA: glycosyltransferase, partial [Thermoanaerobaculia bacterium]|nr:glycosyltransferase [Thermoanaerobaculia bacterium]